MTTRPSLSRRIAAAVLGVERPGRGPRDVTAQRDLPYGRRLLAAVLGVRAGARQVAALSKTRARIDEADVSSAGARIHEADASSAGARFETSTDTRAGATNPISQTPSQNETSELPTTPVAPVPSVAVEPDSPLTHPWNGRSHGSASAPRSRRRPRHGVRPEGRTQKWGCAALHNICWQRTAGTTSGSSTRRCTPHRTARD